LKAEKTNSTIEQSLPDVDLESYAKQWFFLC